METVRRVEVVAGILERDGAVLACRRREDDRHAGRWEFPGGKVEGEESEPKALERELLEELGVRARVGRCLARASHRYVDGPFVEIAFYEVPSFDGEPEPLVFSEIRWVAPGDLPALDFLEADRPFLARMASRS